MATFSPSDLVKSTEIENSDNRRPYPSPKEERRGGGQNPSSSPPNSDTHHSSAHPGFKAVAAKIGQKSGIRNPGAVLAAASRKASPAAKRANPRLNKVKG